MSNKGNTTGAKLELLSEEAGRELNGIRLPSTLSLLHAAAMADEPENSVQLPDNIDELLEMFWKMKPAEVFNYINETYADNNGLRMKMIGTYIERSAFGPRYMKVVRKAMQGLREKISK